MAIEHGGLLTHALITKINSSRNYLYTHHIIIQAPAVPLRRSARLAARRAALITKINSSGNYLYTHHIKAPAIPLRRSPRLAARRAASGRV